MSNVHNQIDKMIAKHYGMKLPIRVVSREDQIRKVFTNECSWGYLNKNAHLVLLWRESSVCVDLVVRWKGELELVQNVCFKDAYPSDTAWCLAIQDVLDQCTEVWVVHHED